MLEQLSHNNKSSQKESSDLESLAGKIKEVLLKNPKVGLTVNQIAEPLMNYLRGKEDMRKFKKALKEVAKPNDANQWYLI